MQSPGNRVAIFTPPGGKMKRLGLGLLLFWLCIPVECRAGNGSIDLGKWIDEYNTARLERKSVIQRRIQELGAVAVRPLVYVYQHSPVDSARQVTAMSEIGSLAPLVSDQTTADPKAWQATKDGMETFFQQELETISARKPLTAGDFTMLNDAAHGLDGLHSLSPKTTTVLNDTLAKVNAAPDSPEKNLTVGTISMMKFSLQQWPSEQAAIMNPPDPAKLPPIPDSLFKTPTSQPSRSFAPPDTSYALPAEVPHPAYLFDPMEHQPKNQVLPSQLPIYDPAIPPETASH